VKIRVSGDNISSIEGVKNIDKSQRPYVNKTKTKSLFPRENNGFFILLSSDLVTFNY
jgi:hypothetical protein